MTYEPIINAATHGIHAAALAVVLTACTSHAPACDETAREIYLGGPNSTMIISDSSNGQTIEVQSIDDQVKVRLNGQELPANRVVREGDKLTILGEDGKPLRELHIYSGDVFAPRAFALGRGGSYADAAARAELAEAYGGTPMAYSFSTGTPPKVMMGITMSEPGGALESHLKLQPGTATMLTGVYEGLPAHSAGLAEFDIITKVDGKTPADPESFRKVLAEKNAGDSVVLTVIHAGGAARDVMVKLDAYDAKRMHGASFKGSDKAQAELLAERVRRGVAGAANWPEAKFFRVAPLPDGATRFVSPEIEAQAAREIGEHLRKLSSIDVKNVDERLKQLDERIAAMEESLKKLSEQLQNRARP